MPVHFVVMNLNQKGFTTIMKTSFVVIIVSQLTEENKAMTT